MKREGAEPRPAARLHGARREHGSQEIVVRKLANCRGVHAPHGFAPWIEMQAKRLPIFLDLAQLGGFDYVSPTAKQAGQAEAQVAHVARRSMDDDAFDAAELLPFVTEDCQLR
jgi:hypothetical protein